MKRITEENEYVIHEKQIYIANMLLKFCKDKGIRCFLVGGSLLGAVKYEGIISGDKDIDIGMLRDDYEKFISLIDELPKDLLLIDASFNSRYNWLFDKLVLKDSKLKDTREPESEGIGIFVDIIPYDYLFSIKVLRLFQMNVAKLLKWLLLAKGETKKRGFKITLLGNISRFIKRDYIINMFKKRKNKGRIVGNIVGGTSHYWFLIEEINDLREVNMNCATFAAPVWTRYLNNNYPGWNEKEIHRNELFYFEADCI